MKILFVHSGADLYGASRSLLRLGTRLVSDGHPVSAILPFEGPLRPALEAAGVRVEIDSHLVTITRGTYQQHASPLWLLPRLALSTWQLYRTMIRLRPDLVHTMTAVLPAPGLAARLAGIPHFWHIRESFAEFARLWRIYQHYIACFADRILCVSTPVAEQFSAAIRARKAVVLHNGFPRAEFEDIDPARPAQFRQSAAVGRSDVAIGVVGRIKYRRKGQEYFVEAASLLHDHYPAARFLCIGSPFPGNEDHLTRLLALIQDLGLGQRLTCTGDAADIKAALAALDILVLPSAQPEPFGGVVIEAMALGKPVVATAIGGSIEQVADGETGFLVPPADPPALAAALARLLEAPQLCDQMGAAGRKRYLELFEFEPFYQKLSGLYAAAVKKEPRP